MRIAFAMLTALALSPGPLRAQAPPAAELLTVAEQSGFRATARYDEVVALMRRLAAASPLGRLVEMGQTEEGRAIPVLILADPPVGSAAEARRAVEAGKLLVLAIGNIHAGEVDGKEALPILARELVTTPNHPLLRDLVIALAPIYNADGNERVSKDNRPGQVGPELGMGQRENANGLDLNRDFIKLEAAETRALVRFFNEWDPAIFIDTHTTNGSFHRYLLTYEGPKNLAGDERVIRFTRDEMLPQVSRDLLAKCAVSTFVYGDFNAGHTRWESYPAQGRYGTNYFGLRNRISILSEGYSYAPYKERVLATRDFVRGCFEFAAANRDRIRKLVGEADAGTVTAGSRPQSSAVVIQCEPGSAPARHSVAGFVEEERAGKPVCTTQPRDYEVEVCNQHRAKLTVQRPFAYLIPPEWKNAIDALRMHGVALEILREEADLQVEAFHITTATFAERPFQNHRLATVEGSLVPESRRIPAGTLLVRTGQPLGSLAVYLLEPQSEDGLTTWNYFDSALVAGKSFPVLRVPNPQSIGSEPFDASATGGQ